MTACRPETELSAARIARCLGVIAPIHPPRSIAADRRAAVLMPLFRDSGDWHLLFIRRAENPLDRHSGEVAFPGGRLEPGDPNPEAAALREAREEIGLAPAGVRLLGRMPPLDTSTDFLVTPVVAEIPWPVRLQPDPREVARIFSIPLGWLANPANREERLWQPPDRSARQVLFFREFDGELLWGASARMTLDFLEALD